MWYPIRFHCISLLILRALLGIIHKGNLLRKKNFLKIKKKTLFIYVQPCRQPCQWLRRFCFLFLKLDWFRKHTNLSILLEFYFLPFFSFLRICMQCIEQQTLVSANTTLPLKQENCTTITLNFPLFCGCYDCWYTLLLFAALDAANGNALYFCCFLLFFLPLFPIFLHHVEKASLIISHHWKKLMHFSLLIIKVCCNFERSPHFQSLD